jgi:hypothetical protein
MSASRMVTAAGNHWQTYRKARQGGHVRQSTLARYAAALEAFETERKEAGAHATLVHMIEALLQTKLASRSHSLIAALNPKKFGRRHGQSLLGTRRRALAIYLAAIELEIGNSAIARALGCKRQNVHQIRATIEKLREDEPQVDVFLDQIGASLRTIGHA